MSNFNYQHQLTQTEKLKRHLIFRSLIAELRCERLKATEFETILCDYCKKIDESARKEFCYHCRKISKFSSDLLKIVELPKLPYSKNFSELDEDDLNTLGVCYVPNFNLNVLVCEKLAKHFGDLSVCKCFYKLSDNTWRLDVDEKLAKNGLLMPVQGRFNGLIYALKVFRHADDPRPFFLKLRGAN
jgi:hypothetical protein